MNASSPDPEKLPERDVRPLESRLQRLRPQPLALNATAILAAAETAALVDVPANIRASSPVAPASVTRESHPWTLMAVGLSGFAAGILLTYAVMNRSMETTAPPVVMNTQTPIESVDLAAVTAPPVIAEPPSPPSISSQSPAAPSPSELAQASVPRNRDPWQAWFDASQTRFNSGTILAVRGSQPRNDLAGLSNAPSRFERRSTPILQPTLHTGMGMGMPAGSTPNDLLDELLGPL